MSFILSSLLMTLLGSSGSSKDGSIRKSSAPRKGSVSTLRRKSLEQKPILDGEDRPFSAVRHRSYQPHHTHSESEHSSGDNAGNTSEYEKYKRQLEEYNRKKQMLELKFSKLHTEKEEELIAGGKNHVLD